MHPKDRNAAGRIAGELVNPRIVQALVVKADGRHESPGNNREPIVDKEISLNEGWVHGSARADRDFTFEQDPLVEFHEEIGRELAEVKPSWQERTAGAIGCRGWVAKELSIANRHGAIDA